MTEPFLEPTHPVAARAEVFVGYLKYLRSQLVTKLIALPADQLQVSRLASGWTPLELLKHLTWVEFRWLEWGFMGVKVADPMPDQKDGRWYVAAGEDLEMLVAALTAQAARSDDIILGHEQSEVGQPGPRWNGAPPATLERICFHLLQEYARHLGHLDIVIELL